MVAETDFRWFGGPIPAIQEMKPPGFVVKIKNLPDEADCICLVLFCSVTSRTFISFHYLVHCVVLD